MHLLARHRLYASRVSCPSSSLYRYEWSLLRLKNVGERFINVSPIFRPRFVARLQPIRVSPLMILSGRPQGPLVGLLGSYWRHCPNLDWGRYYLQLLLAINLRINYVAEASHALLIRAGYLRQVTRTPLNS